MRTQDRYEPEHDQNVSYMIHALIMYEVEFLVGGRNEQ